MFIAEKRRCPRCRETAEWVGLTADVEVRVRVNFVPVGSYHAPSRTAIYVCPTCHHSFKLMPKSARIVGGIAIGAGLLFAWGAASLPHVYGETATMPWLLVITLLGVGFGIIGQDAYRRWRSPVIR
jgi:hypothetical protein